MTIQLSKLHFIVEISFSSMTDFPLIITINMSFATHCGLVWVILSWISKYLDVCLPNFDNGWIWWQWLFSLQTYTTRTRAGCYCYFLLWWGWQLLEVYWNVLGNLVVKYLRKARCQQTPWKGASSPMLSLVLSHLFLKCWFLNLWIMHQLLQSWWHLLYHTQSKPFM